MAITLKIPCSASLVDSSMTPESHKCEVKLLSFFLGGGGVENQIKWKRKYKKLNWTLWSWTYRNKRNHFQKSQRCKHKKNPLLCYCKQRWCGNCDFQSCIHFHLQTNKSTQILFPFSNKDRRTESWIRRKNCAAFSSPDPAFSSSIFIGEREWNFTRHDLDKSILSKFKQENLNKKNQAQSR